MLLKFVKWIYIKREVPELKNLTKLETWTLDSKMFCFFLQRLTFGHLLQNNSIAASDMFIINPQLINMSPLVYFVNMSSVTPGTWLVLINVS